MRIELIVIGNEVLTGFTLNTNAAFIGQQLLEKGYRIAQAVVLPDEKNLLEKELAQALTRSDVIITTGGLGPTLDDVTKQVAAHLFGSDFIFDQAVAQDITERFKHELSASDAVLKNQATVPSKAKILMNPIGTAPGFIFEKERKALIMLPGVPHEMKPMLIDQAIPYIEAVFPLKKRNYRKIFHLFNLTESKVDPLLRKLHDQYPELEYAIYPGLALLDVHVSAEAEDEEKANRKLMPAFKEIASCFATNCYPPHFNSPEAALQHLFIENQWTLSLAESCTGGEAAARITKLAGSSQYFVGSIVAYANEMKTATLGVPPALIAEKGAVSQEVVAEMAKGILRTTGSHFALAVSGIAGPEGGTQDKPVGTVWCAVCRQHELPHTWELRIPGTREMIITHSVNSLFAHLLLYTKETSLL